MVLVDILSAIWADLAHYLRSLWKIGVEESRVKETRHSTISHLWRSSGLFRWQGLNIRWCYWPPHWLFSRGAKFAFQRRGIRCTCRCLQLNSALLEPCLWE
eukprot:c3402_g1_i1 orf=619-921(+)